MTVREATIELGYVDGETLTLEQLDAALDVLSMTKPAQ
jgi:fumarate hydratase class II